jgi:hypothetical protein
MSKKRNYDAFTEDQKKLKDDEQITNLEEKPVTKKNKADLTKLAPSFENAEKAKCTNFIDMNLVLKIKGLDIKIDKKSMVTWDEVVSSSEAILHILPLKEAKIISLADYEIPITKYVDSITLNQKHTHLKDAEKILIEIRGFQSQTESDISKFITENPVIPEYHDLVKKYFEKKQKLGEGSKKIKRKDFSRKKANMKRKSINSKEERKKSKIIFDKLVLKKKRREIKTKYQVNDYYIRKCLKQPKKDSTKSRGRTKKLTEVHLQFIKELLDNRNLHSIRLEDIQNKLLKKYPEIGTVALSTLSTYIDKDLNYSYKKAVDINPKRNQLLTKNYRYYYYQCLFNFIKKQYLLVSIDECGLNETCFQRYGWSPRNTPKVNDKGDIGPNLTLLVAITINGIVGFMLKYQGTTAFHFAFFLRRLKETLFSSLETKNKEPVFIFDNAPFHDSYFMQGYLTKLDSYILFTPRYSPQANPVEYLFGDLKNYLRKQHIISK